MAAWSGEAPIEGPVALRAPAQGGGIQYEDELPSDRGMHGELLHRGRRPAPQGKRGKPQYGKTNLNRQRRAMRKLLCHIGGGPADRNELGVLWLLDNTVANCEEGWPENEITVHPPVCLPCAAKAVDECPELEKNGVTAVRVRDPRSYGVHGSLYALDDTAPWSPFPIELESTLTVAYDDPRLKWMQVGQSALYLVGCTVVDLQAELQAAGLR
ncbi:hypothetical protein [Streptomyces sp. NBC_01304]|uniref:hypothetical protein n=1 Tax=Streptomyces sp. NBC_01304 TaxID=2903818 RepID=UPI002E107703|nr:hypothetical protein OG430_40940 [Streptomyces sp. NBC_01304]